MNLKSIAFLSWKYLSYRPLKTLTLIGWCYNSYLMHWNFRL